MVRDGDRFAQGKIKKKEEQSTCMLNEVDENSCVSSLAL